MRSTKAPPVVEYQRALKRAYTTLLRCERAAEALQQNQDASELRTMRHYVKAIEATFLSDHARRTTQSTPVETIADCH